MGAIFLTSGPAFSYKNANGERKAIKLNNTALIENLKKEIKKYDNLVFVCSSPDEYKKNEEYANLVTKSLSLVGLKFAMMDLIDSRNWLFSKSLINNADLVILLGGNPLEQMEFFESIELKDKLRRYNGCLLGISAGTINLAKNAYCSADEKIPESVWYKGLGLVDISVEPHFDIEDKNRIDSILLKDCNDKYFVALPDESFIIVKEDNIEIYGDAYCFKDGQYQKVSSIELSNIYKGGNNK